MKRVLSFEVVSESTLFDLLKVGISGYGVESAEHGRFTTIFLLLCDGHVLKINGIVTTIEGWHEVGTLTFNALSGFDCGHDVVLLNSNWHEIVKIEQLTIEDDSFSASSGIVIQNSLGEEITIVCGEYPYTLELSAPFFDGDFRPEYELKDYRREAVKRN